MESSQQPNKNETKNETMSDREDARGRRQQQAQLIIV